MAWGALRELAPARANKTYLEILQLAAQEGEARGEGKPETFNFPGFTPICGKNHKTGHFMVYRKSMGKRMAAKRKELRPQMRRRLRESTENAKKWLQAVVRGYFPYHAVPRNEPRLKAFRHEVLRMWLWQLRRRSQGSRWTWETFKARLGDQLPEAAILHPYPEVRFALHHPNFGKNIHGRIRAR